MQTHRTPVREVVDRTDVDEAGLDEPRPTPPVVDVVVGDLADPITELRNSETEIAVVHPVARATLTFSDASPVLATQRTHYLVDAFRP